MGVCSRRQADRLIAQQRVSVNQQLANVGMLISETDTVAVDNEIIAIRPEPVYLLYYKPVGVVCTHKFSVKNSLAQTLDLPQRVFAVGRLDKDSEGLLLLTNQGDIVNKIMRAENKQAKVYRVWVDKPLSDEFIASMSSGVEILQQVTLPCEVERVSERLFKITLVQGLNRQIRRMCQALGYRVERLQRVQIMHLTTQGIEPGKYRHLHSAEVSQLHKFIEHSKSNAAL